MTLSGLFSVLNTALPNKVVYNSWPDGETPALPYVCYYQFADNNFGADDSVYFSGARVNIDLYVKQRGDAAEAAISNALTSAGIYFDRTYEYVDDDKCFLIAHEVVV